MLPRWWSCWYDFIVGDDWRVALGVVAAIIVLCNLRRATDISWLVLPLAVIALLAASLHIATRSHRP